MRPLRLPWLLAVLRPLEVTASFSSLSSPDVSSFLSLQKQQGKRRNVDVFLGQTIISLHMFEDGFGLFFCWSLVGAGLHFFLHTQALFWAGSELDQWWGDLWWGFSFCSWLQLHHQVHTET